MLWEKKFKTFFINRFQESAPVKSQAKHDKMIIISFSIYYLFVDYEQQKCKVLYNNVIEDENILFLLFCLIIFTFFSKLDRQSCDFDRHTSLLYCRGIRRYNRLDLHPVDQTNFHTNIRDYYSKHSDSCIKNQSRYNL